jgi:FixJ family two-component response regulator
VDRPAPLRVSAASQAVGSDGALALQQRLPVEVTTNSRLAARGPVCIVEDDDFVCDSLSVLLETYGFAVLAYASGPAFLGDARRAKAKCLVVDQHMPGLAGLDVVAELHRQGVFLPSILITGRLDRGIAERAAALGVLAILEKPFPVARLVELIGSALGPLD